METVNCALLLLSQVNIYLINLPKDTIKNTSVGILETVAVMRPRHSLAIVWKSASAPLLGFRCHN